MSFATAAQLPAQKPGRSRVVWIGRPAGDVRLSTSGTVPLATIGCAASPNSACGRSSTVGPASAAYSLAALAPAGVPRRREAVERAHRIPSDAGTQGLREVGVGDLRQAALARDQRRQPFVEPFGQRSVVERAIPTVRRGNRRAGAQRAGRLTPWQQREAVFANAID